ncbi:MAG: endonuclease/exonuclease/phosphatase family protein [Paracoccaceae bacterium]|nr:endonuclease/exonuclease/phosphatase family protein [Paracoccaceae bacterium]
MTGLVNLAAGILGALLLGSYAGVLHPLGDSLAVFRLPIAAGLALVVIWAPWRAFWRWGLVAPALVAMAAIVFLKFDGGGAPGPVTVYQKNLLFKNVSWQDLAADIRASGADVVTLQEVSASNAGLLEALRDSYPHQVQCPFTSWAGIAVLSRAPLLEPPFCAEGLGAVGARVTLQGQAVWVISLHLHWPYPYGQRPQVEQLLPQLAALPEPVILGGDFNMVPWGYDVRRLTATVEGARAGALRATLVKRGVPLPIDQVFAPGGGTSEPRPLLGSDHAGVLARVHLDVD